MISIAEAFAFALWAVATFVITGAILHEIGKKYGAHVALDWSTRTAVLAAVGTVLAIAFGFLKWTLP